MEKGLTIIERMIVLAIASILSTLLFQIVSRNSVVPTKFGGPTKQSCLDAGGTWSESIEHGTITQFCKL